MIQSIEIYITDPLGRFINLNVGHTSFDIIIKEVKSGIFIISVFNCIFLIVPLITFSFRNMTGEQYIIYNYI